MTAFEAQRIVATITDQSATGITKQLFNQGAGTQTGGAVDLHGFVGDLIGDICAVNFYRRAVFNRNSLVRQSTKPDCLARKRPSRFNFREHVEKFELDCLVFNQRFAALNAITGIGKSLLECRSCESEEHDPHRNATKIQEIVSGGLVNLRPNEQIIRWNVNIVKKQVTLREIT